MADPLDAYNTEIQRRSGPFGLKPAQTRMGAAAQLPLSAVEGLGGVADYLLDAPQQMGEAAFNYLTGPSKFVRDVRSGAIPESEIPLGTDLVDLFGDAEDVMGAPEFLPPDYVPGEIFSYDPTGEGRTKGMPETRAEREGREAKAALDAQIQEALDAQFDTVAAQKKKDAAQSNAISQIANLNQQFAEDEMGRKTSQETIEAAFRAGLDDFIQSSRGAGPKKTEMSLEDYKKEFSEATGIDISGKVDKSHALMTFGLALMQNKAGKGFNVGKMLASIGEAGQAAMPALEKARTEARAGVLAAGKYALQTRATDRATDAANQEKLMNRGKYWVYKKGAPGEEFSGFDQGEFVDLNKYELNQLINNPDFDKNYEFINASDRLSILEKRAEGADLGDAWGSYERISLIGGKADEVPPELQVLAAPADANYGGTTPTAFKLAENPETVARRFMEYQKSINSGAAKFEVLLENLNKGVSIPNQILGGMKQALRNFGVPAGEMPSTVAQAKRMLNNLAIDNATEILKESGKTLSDNDRKLVKERIGEISWTSGDVDLIKSQLKDIYDLTVLKPQENLDRAVSWLQQNAGIKFGSAQNDKPTEDELKIINENRKARGEPPVTMDDF